MPQKSSNTRRHICFPGCALLCLLVVAFKAEADGQQDNVALQKLVESYAREQAASAPGKVQISVSAIDARLRLAACRQPQAFTPPGGRLWGNSTIGVRCETPAWTIYVPLTIKITGEVMVTARPLSQGHVIQETDLARQNAELTQLPAGVITDPALAVGKTLAASVSSGSLLRNDMLRARLVILQGQTVTVIAQGRGFKISNEGKALNNASVGQLVQIRTQSGQVISATAKSEGIVEIPF